ncbi:MAG: ornithine carbamoyltransferase [Chloroflexota bacterium]
MPGKDLLSVADLTSDDIQKLINAAGALKKGESTGALHDKELGLLFEKPSLRTRVSFEIAMRQLGGNALYLSPAEVGLGQREAIADVARVLSRYLNGLAVRTFSQHTLEVLANNATIPVINALSDREHPCQALADLLTIQEKKGNLAGLTLAFLGDGNNVAHSLLLACSLVGTGFRIASPPGYRVDENILNHARTHAVESGAEILCTEDPREAVSGADVVYTDVWTSMGQETEAKQRRRVFAAYQVNEELLSHARPDAILMHPLPAHRGEEVSPDILDGPQSVVFDQAENRLHLQKALLLRMLGDKNPAGIKS